MIDTDKPMVLWESMTCMAIDVSTDRQGNSSIFCSGSLWELQDGILQKIQDLGKLRPFYGDREVQEMSELVLRICCPTFWALCSASPEYVDDSNKHYINLAKLNQEIEIGLCTIAWLTEE